MAASKSSANRKYNVVLYGASGFVGRQTVDYFARHPEVKSSGLTWALAGRSADRLETVRKASGVNQAGIVVAEAHDAAGPFALYGSELLAACVRHGTHYVDITGETPWVKRMIDQHHDAARRKGARIIPFCGFDSISSDLSAHLANAAMRETQ